MDRLKGELLDSSEESEDSSEPETTLGFQNVDKVNMRPPNLSSESKTFEMTKMYPGQKMNPQHNSHLTWNYCC
jgi:hypothetical protein